MSRSHSLAGATGWVAIAYGILVLVMWLPYGPHSGMGYETTFSQWSENNSLWAGFIFQGDPLRPHTNTFYHLSYLLSFALGIPGSFLAFGLVYILLWWARGFLAYLILQEFLKRKTKGKTDGKTYWYVDAADARIRYVPVGLCRDGANTVHALALAGLWN